jgi:glucose/arabinose dehydrogenase
MQLLFYDGKQFPAEYAGDIFAAQRGSWNKAVRTGYSVLRVPMRGTRASGEYEVFLSGFVTADGNVWGRPVGVAVASDGALLVTDEASNSIWRVSYGAAKR